MVECGECIPKPVLQTKPSAPKAAPPVLILRLPQPAAVPTLPVKGTTKDILPSVLAAEAHIAPQPVQGKASGLPSTILVSQTPTVPKPLEGEVKDAGSHIISPAVGANANLEPVWGRVNDEEFPALPVSDPAEGMGLGCKMIRKCKTRFQKALEQQISDPPGSAPPPHTQLSKPKMG